MSGPSGRHVGRQAIVEWEPTMQPQRTPAMKAAVRMALTPQRGLDGAVVLRITPVASPEAADACLGILGGAAAADVTLSSRPVPGMISLGRGSATVPATLFDGDATRRDVCAGSVCLCLGPDRALVYCCVADEDAHAAPGWQAIPVGSVADPTSFAVFLGAAAFLREESAPWEEGRSLACSCCRLDAEEQAQSQDLSASSVSYEVLADEEVSAFHPFPHDLMDPVTNPKWNPRLWLQCFQPELVGAMREIMGYTCTPPFPWGHHFYNQIFLERCAHLPGDVVELGVAAGGTSVFLARLAQHAGKRLICADSFRGLPPPRRSVDNPHFQEGDFGPEDPATNLLERFEAYATSQGVRPSMTVIASLFGDVQSLPCEQVCFAHLDSDLYDSVRSSLELVYKRLVPGGILVIDDFFHHAQGPARAVSEFFRGLDGPPPLFYPIPPCAVAIQKGTFADGLSKGQYRCTMDGNFYSFEWLRGSDAYLACAEASHARLLAELHARQRKGDPLPTALLRCLSNAARYVTFLRGSANMTGNSGAEVLEYFSCLEHWTDLLQAQREPTAIKL